MKKKWLSVLLALTMCLTLLPAGVFAAEGDSVEAVVTKTDVQADSVINSEGYAALAIVDETGQTAPQYALMDASGKMVFDYGQFPCAFSLTDGLFVNGIVTQQQDGYASGVYSLFDLNGNQVIDETYDYLVFDDGYGTTINRTFQEDGTFVDTRTVIDAEGNVVLTLPDGFNLIYAYGGGDFTFEQMLWDSYYFGEVGYYGDGLMWLVSGADLEENIFEAQGLTEDSPEYTENANIMSTVGGPYCGYMDLQGNVVIAPQYYAVYPFVDGIAAVQEYEEPSTAVEDLPYGTDQGGDWKFIDTKGNEAFAGRYTDAGYILNGYTYVANQEGKYGYINTQGEIVVPMEYDAAFGAGDGLFSVGNQIDGVMKYGIVDENNEIVVPLEYDDITHPEKGVAYGVKDGQVYVISFQQDVPSDWAAQEVESAIQAGLVPQHLQDNYKGGVTRGEVAEMFILLLETVTDKDIDTILSENEVTLDKNAFTDTTDESVLAANALGIISGVGDNRYDPEGTLTRAHVAAILNRIAGVLGVETEGYTHSFTDVSGHWSDGELGWPVHAGIISGVGDNRFDPNGTLTTEQAIAMVWRALEALSE